jgi:hypothetical protein
MEALTAAFSTGNASLLEWVDVARSLLDLEMEMVVLHGDLSAASPASSGPSERRSLERPCMRIRRHEYRRNTQSPLRPHEGAS